MKQKKMTLQGRALCAALALVLAVGSVPSQALTSNAYAANGDGSSSDIASTIHSEDVALDQSATQSGAGISESESAADASQSSGANANAEADAAATDAAAAAASDNGSASNAAPAADLPATKGSSTAPEADDILNIQVNVADGAEANAVIAFGGMAYVQNDDGENTVSVIGWTGTAPKGALTIPQTIRNGQTDYSVTRVAIAGGGSRSLPILRA